MTTTAAVGSAMVGAGLSIVGTLAYLLGIRRGSTTPHRGSWLVWSAVALIAACAHAAAGGRWGLVVLVVQAASTVTVLGVAVRGGVGGVAAGNVVLLGVAGVGIIGWQLVDDPLVATCCVALADGAGLVAITPKIWREPDSETGTTYALAALSGLSAVVSVRSRDVALLLFPAYFCLGNAAIALLIGCRRRWRGRSRVRDLGVVPSVGAVHERCPVTVQP
ncbi:MAG: hypothetical protein IPK24_20970 [Kineosporiaceae bacterium]|nr:hypothetical protein [Kineosporiaceae bacterium]MBK8077961.1 hypothetical protein [Kineosporiaceae bacterium]